MYFFRKYKNGMMVALVTIILFIIIGNTGDKRLDISKGEKILMNSLVPVNQVISSLREKVFNTFSTIRNLTSLLDENENLKKQVAKLEEENRNLEDIIGKSDYLRNEKDLLDETDLDLLPARVISKEAGNWYNSFNIDKGSKDGIEKGATVVQGIKLGEEEINEGMVGRVAEVSENSAKVLAIIDAANSIAFKTIRTQDGGIISGSLDGVLTGYLFDNQADIIVGDKLYTSGLGGTFKEDIYVGDVIEVEDVEEELIKRITVEPAIDFKKIYRVLVVTD